MSNAPEFTRTGITVQTFDEIFQGLIDEYKAIYGDDIDVSQNTPDGQKIAIEAKLISDLQAFGAQLYNQIDPDFSIGEIQKKILKLTGITPNPATRSSVDVTITTDRSLTLESGYTVADDQDQNWVTTREYSLVSGSNTVTLEAENFGKVEAPAGTITEPVTIVIGVESVTNPSAATPGVDEETEEEVRVRRNKSLENPSLSTVGSLFASLANLDAVTNLRIYENDTNTYDTTLDLAAHSLWVVIRGGDIADIAEIITKDKTGGTGLKGSTTGTYTETLVKPDGNDITFIYEQEFDRPGDVPVYVQVTATRIDPAEPVDTALIAEKIAGREFDINENLQAAALYSHAYQAGTNFILTDMQISLDDSTYTDEKLDSDFDKIFSISATDVTVTEITP